MDLPPHEGSTRLQKEPERFGEEATEDEILEAENRRIEHHAYVVYETEPHTYQQAIQSPYAKQWEKAMSDELAQLDSMGSFKWVSDVPPGKRPIGSRWVYKEKRDEKGVLVKHKARIVAQGFLQVPGQDYLTNGTYASVVHFTTL